MVILLIGGWPSLAVVNPRFSEPVTRARAARRRGDAKTSCFGGAPRSLSSTWRWDCLTNSSFHVIPVVLGDGARLFDNLRGIQVQFEQVRAVEAPGVTHLEYRSVK